MVVVVGDVFIDRYIHVAPRKISAEAPMMVVDHLSQEDRWGGAANVAANAHSVHPVLRKTHLFGFGQDGFVYPTSEFNLHLVEAHEHMPVKQRIVAQGWHQMLRVDKECWDCIKAASRKRLLSEFRDFVSTNREKLKTVCFTDYSKGTIDKRMIDSALRARSKNYFLLMANPKPERAHLYRGFDLVVMNEQEAQSVTGEKDNLSKALRDKLGVGKALVTLGPKGMELDGETYYQDEVEVSDVTGAGDTVAGVIAACADIEPSTINMAQDAAVRVVQKPGTSLPW